MATYGRTWWGKKWLEAFNGIDYGNRLPRGRSYANTGRAYDIIIKGHIITAKVRGSAPKPYKVEVILNAFSENDKEAIHQIISHSPTILSGLIVKKLPTQLLTKLNQQQIRLFPSNWKEINASCSCPDWAMPCKHIAAVIYLIGAEIDKNPFMVFQIHDCDLLELISDFSNGKLARAQKILQIEDIFQPDNSLVAPFNQAALDEINLSIIQNLAERIKVMLKDNPSFYDKNFREILHLVYKHWQSYPTGKSAHFAYLGSRISNIKINPELSEEEIFTEKWSTPQNWNSFQLVLDDQHHLIQVLCDAPMLFNSQKTPALNTPSYNLVRFLQEIPNSLLHTLNPEIRFMHMLSQFAIKLMEKSAFIPQILQNKWDETFIRWVPGLFDQAVKDIYQKLCTICSPNLVQCKELPLSSEEQVKAAMAVIFSGLMAYNLPSSFEKYPDNNIFKLFFKQQPYKFTAFNTKELPAAINQWLSNLYLSARPHKIYLMVEEKNWDFGIELKVSLDDKKEPVSLQKALIIKDVQAKLAILSDLSLVTEYIPELEEAIDSGNPIFFNLNSFAPLFLNILPVLKAVGIIVILPKTLQKILAPQLTLNLKAKDKIKDDRESFLNLETLLNFDWKIAIGDKKLSVAEFKKLLKESRGLVRIMDAYVLLDEKEMQLLLKQLENLPDHLSQAELMQAALSGELNGANVDLDQHLTDLFNQLNTYRPISVPYNLKAQLRPYQERGFNWLVQNINASFGSILADDMGLGKTLQVITAILHFKNQGFLGAKRVLVVAPTSLLNNWQREIERFAPELNIFIYHGQSRELAIDCDIVITSYGLARRDKKELNQINWFLMVIDEAQNIKNPTTEQTKALKSIRTQHKIALSGTPVENRLLEYWSIIDFTNKHYLGTPKQFKERFAIPIEKNRDKDCLERFKKITAPFILRRLKSDKSIIQDLPDKIENNRYCSLTSEQTALYQEVVNISVKKIEGSEGIERKGLVLKLINALKQICNHPSQFGKKKTAAIEQSGKLQMLEEILSSIEDLAEKSLIFTQYTEMGKIIAQLLEARFNTTVPFLHGGLSLKARDEMVHNFQNLSQRRILIVSLKAGGTGLNLTAANHVIHYDLWWNPAVEAQATDRAYRIGQTRNVMVHRLLATGTFEERIDEMIKSKKELADLTVGSGENWITEMSTEQLKDLVSLRKLS